MKCNIWTRINTGFIITFLNWSESLHFDFMQNLPEHFVDLWLVTRVSVLQHVAERAVDALCCSPHVLSPLLLIISVRWSPLWIQTAGDSSWRNALNTQTEELLQKVDVKILGRTTTHNPETILTTRLIKNEQVLRDEVSHFDLLEILTKKKTKKKKKSLFMPKEIQQWQASFI